MSGAEVMVVRPTTGGVAHVGSNVVAELRRQDRSVHDIALTERAAPAWQGVYTALRLVRSIRQAGVVHIELGRTTAAPFWFALVAVSLRPDVVVVAHDAPVLVDAPGAAVVPARRGWRDAVAHRIFAPLLDRRLTSYMRRRVGAVAVLSELAGHMCREAGIKNIGLIQHGADAPVSGPRPSQSRTVVFGGFLSPAKGLEDLLDAWQRIGQGTGFQLIVAGKSSRQHADWHGSLKETSAGWENPPVWTGYLDDQRFNRLIADAAVVVLPYRSSNPASGILIRAMVQGRAVVATRLSAMESLIAHAINGQLYDVRDIDSLAQELDALIRDPAERDRLGAEAARTAALRHSWKRQVEDLDHIYALAGGPR
jgi:glycosyltransferase involved in cell wall biosynthesis